MKLYIFKEIGVRILALRSQLPWCIIEDFNGMMFAHEKYGRRAH